MKKLRYLAVLLGFVSLMLSACSTDAGDNGKEGNYDKDNTERNLSIYNDIFAGYWERVGANTDNDYTYYKSSLGEMFKYMINEDSTQKSYTEVINLPLDENHGLLFSDYKNLILTTDEIATIAMEKGNAEAATKLVSDFDLDFDLVTENNLKTKGFLYLNDYDGWIYTYTFNNNVLRLTQIGAIDYKGIGFRLFEGESVFSRTYTKVVNPNGDSGNSGSASVLVGKTLEAYANGINKCTLLLKNDGAFVNTKQMGASYNGTYEISGSEITFKFSYQNVDIEDTLSYAEGDSDNKAVLSGDAGSILYALFSVASGSVTVTITD